MITIDQQIEEVRREIRKRNEVYPRLVSQRRLRQGEADHMIERMRAVLVTLEFCRDNRSAIADARARIEGSK